MPSPDKASPLMDMDTHSPADGPADADALSLAAEEAEAEAAEAEALAAAAQAKAKAIRLRREAAETLAAEARPVAAADSDDGDGEETEPAEGKTEPAEQLEPSGTPKPRFGPGWLSVVAATLIVVLSAVLLGAGGWIWRQHDKAVAEQHRRAEFAAAAAQGVVNMMSLDYRHAKDDVQRIIDGTTGDFKKDFQTSAADFIKVAESSKSVTEATVTATAVQTMAQDTATVLVAATTKVSNAASKDQQPRSWRWSVDVARDGGQIKLAKVEIVP